MPAECPFEIEKLKGWGFRPATLANWRDQGRVSLLPLQARAVRETGFLGGANLVVFAPTSSGKTFVAELAAVRQWEQGRKAVFLVPTKALAEEQFAYLDAAYSPLGIRTVIATRERRLHDGRILRGEFDFAVMVYEKLKAFLGAAPDLLKQLGLVAVDELQILGEGDRGSTVDLLLARIAALHGEVQLVALSAVLAENSRLADWLHADMLIARERPLELREGVFRLSDRTFLYREANSGREGEEPILPEGETPDYLPVLGGDEEDAYFPAALYLTEEFLAREEQVLIFVPTRHLSRMWAARLGHSLPGDPAEEALTALAGQEENHSRQLLEECFRHSVAYHNSDLPHELRLLVEREFNAGRLKVLVATSTLAQGVNLKVRNVLAVPVMLDRDPFTGGVRFVDLKRQLWRNMGGRAGRMVSSVGGACARQSCTCTRHTAPDKHSAGAECQCESGKGGGGAKYPFGRSILLAGQGAEEARLMREFVHADVEPLESAISGTSLGKLALDLVSTGPGFSFSELRRLLGNTYSARIGWGAFSGELDREIEKALQELRRGNLIRQAAQERFQPTGVGHAAAAYGITPDTVSEFRRWCLEWTTGETAGTRHASDLHDLEVLCLCAGSPDGEGFALAATAGEIRAQRYAAALSERRDFHLPSCGEPVRSRLLPGEGLPEASHSMLKKAFVAEAWISTRATYEIEQEFELFAGTISNLGSHLSWLAQALASIAQATRVPREVVARLGALARRLPEGLPEEAEELGELGVPGLARGHMLVLMNQGFASPDALADLEAGTLERWIPRDTAERLIGAAQELMEEKRREAENRPLWELVCDPASYPDLARDTCGRRLSPAEELDLPLVAEEDSRPADD